METEIKRLPLAVDGPCPACGNGKYHREGCPVIPRDAELSRLKEEKRELVGLLVESQSYLGGDWRERRDTLLAKVSQ